MPIIVSQSLASSHPLDHSAVKAVGISLPITRGTTGYFQQTYTTAEAIRYDLINLLLTNKGERPLNPMFGSDLNAIVFQQNVDDIQESVNSVVRSAISRYMPFVIVDKITTSNDYATRDIYRLKISLTYHVPNIVGYTDLAFLVNSS